MLDLLTRVLARSWLHLMSAPMETVTCTITGGLCRASLFDGANQDHDYYLAHAASLRCLETCFPKETTEGQLLSAELFSLLSMCVLAACLWPTDPEQQHEMGPRASPTPPPPTSTITEASKYALCRCLNMNIQNAHIHSCQPSGKTKKKERDHAGSCVDVSFDFFVWNSRKILFKNPLLNSGCLTEMHTNTAIIGGRKLYSVAVANSLVQWNKALCCYVKVSACNCSGCFEGFIIYIFLCFSKGAY